LEGALKFLILDGSGETIVMAVDYLDKIQEVVDNFSEDGQIPVSIVSNGDSEDEESAMTMLQLLEGLLPNAEEDADAFKSLWDTVMEIHGREAVKYHETKNPTLDWKLACVVARLLLHFDFLTLGIVTSSLIKS
jgi:Cft2 family RNA processing exonuclease